MNEKVYIPNSFQTPNVLVDKVMPYVSGSAFKILVAITRHTIGWHEPTVGINLDGLQKITGLSRQGVINGLEELRKVKLILIKKGPRNSRIPNIYALNLDLTTGELANNLDRSKKLTDPIGQDFRLVQVKKIDSLVNTETQESEKSENRILNRLSSSSKTKRLPLDPEPEDFVSWYQLYPRHEGREKALKAWRQINPDPALIQTITLATRRYAAVNLDTEKRFILLPATWLDGKRWQDELEDTELGSSDQMRKELFING